MDLCGTADCVRRFGGVLFGATALGEAARWGRLDLVQELLSSGSGADDANAAGVTPLAIAASAGCLRVVQYLIERGADVNAVAKWRGMTPLMACVAGMNTKRGYLAVAEMLLRAGAARSLSAKDEDGKTALDWAKDGRPKELVALIETYLQGSTSV